MHRSFAISARTCRIFLYQILHRVIIRYFMTKTHSSQFNFLLRHRQPINRQGCYGTTQFGFFGNQPKSPFVPMACIHFNTSNHRRSEIRKPRAPQNKWLQLRTVHIETGCIEMVTKSFYEDLVVDIPETERDSLQCSKKIDHMLPRAPRPKKLVPNSSVILPRDTVTKRCETFVSYRFHHHLPSFIIV